MEDQIYPIADQSARRSELLLRSDYPPYEVSPHATLQAKMAELEKIAINKKGAVSFIGRLVVAVPDGQNWTKLYDEDGNLIRKRDL